MISRNEIVLIEFLAAEPNPAVSEFKTLQLLPALKERFEECFVLPTCQRLLLCVYVADVNEIIPVVDTFFPDTNYRIFRTTRESANHLFRVASGLESRILGEHEIQGQMIKWLSVCTNRQLVGSVLGEFIRQAIHCGKIIRGNTGVGSLNLSYASLTLKIIRERFGHLKLKYLLIGTGDIARRIVQILSRYEVDQLLVASHDSDRAREFTKNYFGRAISIEQAGCTMCKVDVVIGGTHGEVFFHENYATNTTCERNRICPMPSGKLVIDLGMPANFPGLNGKENYIGISEVISRADRNQRRRSACLPQAEKLIHNHVNDYMIIFRERKLGGLLGSYWRQLAEVQGEELNWLLPKLGDVSEDDRRLIALFAHRLIRKIAKTPIKNIRTIAETLHGDQEMYSTLAFVLNKTKTPEK